MSRELGRLDDWSGCSLLLVNVVFNGGRPRADVLSDGRVLLSGSGDCNTYYRRILYMIIIVQAVVSNMHSLVGSTYSASSSYKN